MTNTPLYTKTLTVGFFPHKLLINWSILIKDNRQGHGNNCIGDWMRNNTKCCFEASRGLYLLIKIEHQTIFIYWHATWCVRFCFVIDNVGTAFFRRMLWAVTYITSVVGTMAISIDLLNSLLPIHYLMSARCTAMHEETNLWLCFNGFQAFLLYANDMQKDNSSFRILK